MRGVAWVFVLGTAACTAPNPAYQADDGQTGPVGSDTTVAESSTGSATTGEGESTGGDVLCVLHDPRPYDIHVSGLEPDCTVDDEVVWIDEGSNLYPPTWDRIDHELCEPLACDCPLDPAPMRTIQLAGDAVFAEGVALPGCGRMALWSRRIDDSCQWAGLVMWEGDDILPSVIVSRTLDVPPFAQAGTPFEMSMLATDETCPDADACSDARAPGQYAIDVLGQHAVTVEESPKLVDIEFGLAGTRTYLFDNRMSSLTRECRPQLAWSAQLWQQAARPPPA